MTMTAQQIFDIVSQHLLTMPNQALTDSGSCAYRGDDGSPCAVGILLTDEEAEGLDDGLDTSIKGVAREELLPSRLVPYVDLLQDLQDVHDNSSLWEGEDRSKMQDALIKVSNEYGLEFNS